MRRTLTELAGLRKAVVLLLLFLFLSLTTMRSASAAFSPKQGDFFRYTEMINLGNGTGNYLGYTENENATGGENVTGVSGSIVSMNYGYSYTWHNSSGTTLTGSSGGPYTFSDTTFLYVNGSDNETSFGGIKYTDPAVWFAMNSSLPAGSNFTILNSQLKIVSRNATVFVPTQSVIVSAILAQGSGSYQRNDIYGEFNAAYSWSVWYDPSTGYIIGYNYVEHDTNATGDGFTYSDKLYVSASSYPLSVLTLSTHGETTVPVTTTVSTPSISSSTSPISTVTLVSESTATITATQTQSQTSLYYGIVGIAISAVLLVIVLLDFMRRRRSSTTTQGNP